MRGRGCSTGLRGAGDRAEPARSPGARGCQDLTFRVHPCRGSGSKPTGARTLDPPSRRSAPKGAHLSEPGVRADHEHPGTPAWPAPRCPRAQGSVPALLLACCLPPAPPLTLAGVPRPGVFLGQAAHAGSWKLIKWLFLRLPNRGDMDRKGLSGGKCGAVMI